MSTLKQGNEELRTSPIWLATLFAVTFTGLAVTGVYNANKYVQWNDDLWQSDLWNAPSTVPFPGRSWLDRIAAMPSNKGFEYQGNHYTSAYAAMLPSDPIDEPARNFSAYLNSMVVPPSFAGTILSIFGLTVGHYVLCYLRNFLGAMVLYYGTAAIFHYFCYIHAQSNTLFEESQRTRPSYAIMWDQIQLSQLSMFLFVMLPVIDEILVEQGWTKAFYTVHEIGGWMDYTVCMIMYFACVEIGIYWMHRTLHTNKWLYKNIHLKHHKYNKPETLTPWASIAFHPIDGMLQASPYVMSLFLVPCHYPTHYILLFFTALWATYIHDAMDFNVGPIMGSKYHTVHHTHYLYNYGQVFVFCDYIWGTLRTPQHPTGSSQPQKLK